MVGSCSSIQQSSIQQSMPTMLLRWISTSGPTCSNNEQLRGDALAPAATAHNNPLRYLHSRSMPRAIGCWRCTDRDKPERNTLPLHKDICSTMHARLATLLIQQGLDVYSTRAMRRVHLVPCFRTGWSRARTTASAKNQCEPRSHEVLLRSINQCMSVCDCLSVSLSLSLSLSLCLSVSACLSRCCNNGTTARRGGATSERE